MNAHESSDDAEARDGEGARVRWFIVAHGVALALVYVLAWVTGDGFAGPPMPPQTARTPPAAPVQAASTAEPAPFAAGADAAAELPAWARRAEVHAPWAQGR